MAGAEIWDFTDKIGALKVYIKNESEAAQNIKMSLKRFTPEHKWQAHGERKFFDYYKYHNEAEWGSEHKESLFTELKSVSLDIEGNYCGLKEIKFDLSLENAKNYMTDDDRLLAVITTESDSLYLAYKEKLNSHIRMVKGIDNGEFTVCPYTPYFEISPSVNLGRAANILNGYNRRFSENPLNMWVPNKMPAYLKLNWNEKIKAKEIRITFDTLERASHDMPYECGKRASAQCVKSFDIELLSNNEVVKVIKETMHHNRLYVNTFDEIEIDEVKLNLHETWEEKRLPGVYEIRVY